MPGDDEPLEAWVTALSITDTATGRAEAERARDRLLTAGKHVLGQAAGGWTPAVQVFCGLLARAQGLHEGAVTAIADDNPYAAFTVLRSYAENAAAVLYVKDHLTQLNRFWDDGSAPDVPIGKITNYADHRFDGFRGIYSQLSRYAHPAALSVLASTRLTASGRITWASSPSFRSQREVVLACAWTVELATATSHLLVEFGEASGIIPAS